MAIPLALMSNMGAAAGTAAAGANAAQGAAAGAAGGFGSIVGKGIGTAISLGQLLIGENSLFSGKKRLASRMMKQNFDASQKADIDKGFYDVQAQQAARANQGLSGATLGLARMEQGRAMAAQLGALGGRRSALAGLPGLGISSNDFALRLAASNEMAQRQNQAAYEGTQLQVAGLRDANAQRKRDEAASYWGAQRQESDQSISSALAGLGASFAAQKTANATTPKTT